MKMNLNDKCMDETIKQTMDYKGKQIKKFVDAKEKSMALFAAGRDSAMIVAELCNQGKLSTDEEIKAAIHEYRKFFYYEIYSTDPDEEAIQKAKQEVGKTTEFLGF